MLVVTAGDVDRQRSRPQQRADLVEALRRGADVAEDGGITLILEPLNTRLDHPNAFLDSTLDAIAILREIDSEHIKLLYDAYHSVMLDEDPSEVLGGAEALIAHIQIADRPGRARAGIRTRGLAEASGDVPRTRLHRSDRLGIHTNRRDCRILGCDRVARSPRLASEH